MPRRKSGRDAILQAMTPLVGDAGSDPKTRQRQLLADMCRLIGDHLDGDGQAEKSRVTLPSQGSAAAEEDDLPPRLRQTLQSLLAGDSEKQAARKLGLSPHTVHVYVKKLYRKFGVCSRGELLARWVKNG